MINYFHLLRKNYLFSDIPDDKLDAVVSCMNGFTKTYHARTLLFCAGNPVPYFGMVLKGCVELFLSGTEGNPILLSQFYEGDLFAQSLTIADASSNIFEIYASEDTEILFLTVPKFTALENCHCMHRFKVMENLMTLIAEDNMKLLMKIEILTQNSLRQKLQLYFLVLSKEQQSRTVTLPFGRDKLSSYLSCDRSAISRELGRMKQDGLISYTKNTVTLLTPDSAS